MERRPERSRQEDGIPQVRGGVPAGAEHSPPCAICGAAGKAGRERRHLTHGVAVWLCERHGSDSYVIRERGELFVRRLAAMWAATGSLTVRKMRALDAHLDRVRGLPGGRQRPGSYSWPRLRREAERRFASGDDPNAVIRELRAGYADGPAMVPSVRTMRRWFVEARWLAPAGSATGRSTTRRWTPPRPPSLVRALAGIALYPLLPLPDLYAFGRDP